MQIIEAINNARTRQGISKAELGRRAGFSRAFIHNMPSHPDIQTSTACKLADALDCEIVLRDSSGNETVITAEP